MSDGIRKVPGAPHAPAAASDTSATKAPTSAEGSKAKEADGPSLRQEGTQDTFDTGASKGGAKLGQLQHQLQALAQKSTAKIVFTSQDLRLLAETFASTIRQHPEATRKLRAGLFAKAVLKQRRLRALLGHSSEAEMEHMCDLIGDALESSPVFAQLVDDVTDGAGTLGRRDHE